MLETTLCHQIHGIAAQSERAYKGQTPSSTGESTLSAWLMNPKFFSQPAYYSHLGILLLEAIRLAALLNTTQN